MWLYKMGLYNFSLDSTKIFVNVNVYINEMVMDIYMYNVCLDIYICVCVKLYKILGDIFCFTEK